MSNDAASWSFTRSISPRSAPVMTKSSTYSKILLAVSGDQPKVNRQVGKGGLAHGTRDVTQQKKKRRNGHHERVKERVRKRKRFTRVV